MQRLLHRAQRTMYGQLLGSSGAKAAKYARVGLNVDSVPMGNFLEKQRGGELTPPRLEYHPPALLIHKISFVRIHVFVVLRRGQVP